MNLNLKELITECEQTIQIISKKIENSSNKENTELLTLKINFLTQIKQIIEQEKTGINKITEHLENNLKQYINYISQFKTDLDTFRKYIENLEDNPEQTQISWLKLEYKILLEDKENLLQNLSYKNDNDNNGIDKTTKIYQLLENNLFLKLDNEMKSKLHTNQIIYIFTILYNLCESDKTYNSILEGGFADGIFKREKIEQLDTNQLVQVIKEFVQLREKCQSDETYKGILIYGFSKGILKNKPIRQLNTNQIVQLIKEFVQLREKCQSDETYEDILRDGFTYEIFNFLNTHNYEIFIKYLERYLNINKVFKIQEFTINLYFRLTKQNLEYNKLTQKEKEKVALKIIQKYELTEPYCLTKNESKIQKFFSKFSGG
jgi:hypothetical protein